MSELDALTSRLEAVEANQLAVSENLKYLLRDLHRHTATRERDDTELIGAIAHICRTLDRIDEKLQILLTREVTG